MLAELKLWLVWLEFGRASVGMNPVLMQCRTISRVTWLL